MNLFARYAVGAATQAGRFAAENEDASASFDASYHNGRRLRCAVVSDGVSGKPGASQASQTVVATVRQYLKTHEAVAPQKRMVDAVRTASNEIYQESLRSSELRGMGATIVLALIDNDLLSLAHVGDSRAFLVRRGRAYLLTEDHTKIEEQVRAGIMERREANIHPERHWLSQRLGKRESIRVDTNIFDLPAFDSFASNNGEPVNGETVRRRSVNLLRLEAGDTVVLCSDGLPPEVLYEKASQWAWRYGLFNVKRQARALVAAAVNVDGDDDTTVVLMHRRAYRWLVLRLALVLFVVGLGLLANLRWDFISTLAALFPRETPAATPSTTPTVTPPVSPEATNAAEITMTAAASQTAKSETATAAAVASRPTPPQTRTPTSTPRSTNTPTSRQTAALVLAFRPTATFTPVPSTAIEVATPTPITTPAPTAAGLPNPQFPATSPITAAISSTVGINQLPAPILVSDFSEIRLANSYDFKWKWEGGPLPPGLGFEIQLSKDGGKKYCGIENAQKTTDEATNQNGIYTYRFEIPIEAGQYLWRVRLIRLGKDEGKASDPRAIRIIGGTVPGRSLCS